MKKTKGLSQSLKDPGIKFKSILESYIAILDIKIKY
jgi:hypothetical protein